jgi:hypothetical protein
VTSREIVRRTLAFEAPERIAMSLPEPYPNDFRFAGPRPDPAHPGGDWREVDGGRWERTDEWGNTWARIEGFSKGEVARGAVEDWDRLDQIELPDYDLPQRYEPVRKAFEAEPERFRVGFLPGFPFNVARKMRRLDNFLVDVLAEPDRAERLLAVVEEQLAHAIRRMGEAGADAVMFPEDWGTQDRLLVSPSVWDRMFRPGFERLCRVAREAGVFVLMHSCGHIYEAMEGLIAAGIDCFQFDQPELYGVDRLAEEFGGRIAFWCPVDIQKVLQARDAERIRAAARHMMDRLGTGGGGGFIAGYYPSNEAIGLDPKWQDVACRAFVEYGAPELWPELRERLAASA